MIINDVFSNMINSPVRYLKGRVEVYEGSTLTLVCNCNDRLKEFSIERIGEGKFFGYGICQKVNVKLIDQDRELAFTTDNNFNVGFGVNTNYIYPFPRFYVSEVHRDEITNELSITAYDALYRAAEHTVNELTILAPYTINDFAIACGAFLGLSVVTDDIAAFNLSYEQGANLEGTESIRDVLNAIAEATQTIYYIDNNQNLVFKKLDISGNAVYTIDKEKYIDLESGENRRLATIVNSTELGDNLSVSTSAIGSTQYIHDNPFWDLREDRSALLDAALANIGGLTINQFSCNWRGNFLLEIGDKIELITKDNEKVYSYLLNDSLSFDGSLSQNSQWSYEDNETETESNPNNLGDLMKKTFAKVDKVNKQVDIVVSDSESTKEYLTNLQLTTDNITATVETMETALTDGLKSVNGDLTELSSKVAATMTAEDVQIQITNQLSNGVDKVVTSTGFTFDNEGLTVSKSDSEISTKITEDGMEVYRGEEAVLTANNVGVNATNLHATTYLIVGKNSRFEDFGENRTGCFWIGGVS